MNGPIKKPKIGLGLGALEVLSIIFGLIVVVGVLLESGSEIWQSILDLQIPSRVAIGGALVALGVFGEVAIGVFIARSAKREQIESSERVARAEQAAAEANERVAEAQKETARLQLDLYNSRLDRVFLFPLNEFIEHLKARPKGIAEVMYQPEDPEAATFATTLWGGFMESGWSMTGNPLPIPPDLFGKGRPVELFKFLPAILRAGGNPTRVSIIGGTPIDKSPNAESTPFKAVLDFNGLWPFVSIFTTDPGFPANFVRVLVGPK